MGETIVYAVKIAAAIAAAVAFIAAIDIIIGLIPQFSINAYFSEVIRLVGLYLPFNPRTIFTLLSTLIGSVFVFLAARKIFQLLHTVHKDS